MTEIIDLYPFLSSKNVTNALQRIAVSYSWVPKEFQRRLEAYTILAAYEANLSNQTRLIPEENLYEFGDAKFVCTAMSSSVLGDEVKIVAPDDKKIEEFFRTWAEDELFFAKMVANEYKASNLGDCVYRLYYSKGRGRVEVTTLDPGFWFPFNLGLADERHVFAWETKDEKSGKEVIYKEEYFYGTNGGQGQAGDS